MSEANFSATVKDQKGNLLTVRGSTYDEYVGNLAGLGLDVDAIVASYAHGFGQEPSSLVTHEQAVTNVTNQLGGQVVPQPAPVAQTAPAKVAPQGIDPETGRKLYGDTCPHGTMVLRKSQPGAPKTWAAYMCPSPKGTADQCEPQWCR